MRRWVWVWVAVGCGSTVEPTDSGATTAPAEQCPAPWTSPDPSPASCTATRDLDSAADGTVESRTVETYSPAGQLLRVETDYGPDGDPDFLQVNTYDGDLLTHIDQELTGDDVFDAALDLAYDDQGRVVEVVITDGTGTTRRTTTHGPCGPVLDETDAGDDGTVDQRATTSWTATSRVVEEDRGGDGAVDRVTSTTLDATLGRPTRTEDDYDLGAAGPESAVDVAYDPVTGQKALETVSSASTVAAVAYEYDADGRLVDVLTSTEEGPVTRTTIAWSCPL